MGAAGALRTHISAPPCAVIGGATPLRPAAPASPPAAAPLCLPCRPAAVRTARRPASTTPWLSSRVPRSTAAQRLPGSITPGTRCSGPTTGGLGGRGVIVFVFKGAQKLSLVSQAPLPSDHGAGTVPPFTCRLGCPAERADSDEPAVPTGLGLRAAPAARASSATRKSRRQLGRATRKSDSEPGGHRPPSAAGGAAAGRRPPGLFRRPRQGRAAAAAWGRRREPGRAVSWPALRRPSPRRGSAAPSERGRAAFFNSKELTN